MTTTSHDASDPELVRRSLAGETDAFAQLVEKHQRLVFGVALSGARDVGEAEDVAQEAFVEAWRDLPRLRDHGRVGTWIAGIARNLALGWSRRSARRRKREEAVPHGDAVQTPLDTALDRETRTLVQSALDEIPAAYREVLVLYYVQGRSAAEVASGLGISEDLVKQRLSRGRRALRATLETRVEGALEALAPTKAFTATVMVAVSTAMTRKAAGATTATTAGKAVLGMTATKAAGIGTAVLIAGGVGWYSLKSDASEPKQLVAPQADLMQAVTYESPLARASAGGNARSSVRKLASPEARLHLLHAIRSAQQRRAAGATTPATRPALPASTTIDKNSDDRDREYIREAVRGLLPMVTECYEAALDGEPNLAGSLVVNFTIEGEPDVGGLVTESVINKEQSEIQNAGMQECLQETMFALEIDPPTGGGTVKVTYPFVFRPQ